MFYFDTRDLPAEYAGNPRRYINNVLKPIAKAKHAKLVEFIKKEYKLKNMPKKDLVMNYQLIPFRPEEMLVKIDAENYPKPVQRLMISSVLSYNDKKKLIRSHVFETKRFISQVTPFSLVAKSVSPTICDELRKSEATLLQELRLVKNGSIELTGIQNILNHRSQAQHILRVFQKKLKVMKVKIKNAELKDAFEEMISNAERIQEKIQ